MADETRSAIRGDWRQRAFPSAPILCARGRPAEAWIDYNDHMNLGYYLIAIDQAVEACFEDWTGIGPSMAEEVGMGSFVLQSHMHFLQEIRRDELYEVRLQLLECDHKRWRYIATLSNAASGARAATAEQIAMCVDHATRRSAPLPETQKRRLEEMLAAHRDLPKAPQIGAPLGIRRPVAL